MTDLKVLSEQVVNAICRTEEYINYKKCLEEIKKDPVLYKRLNELREKNFRLRQENPDDIIELMDALTNEYDDVINIELTSEFIEAEATFCRMFQEFNQTVIDGLEFD